MNNDEIMALEDNFQLKTYRKLPIAVVKGKGSYVWDANGRKYIDFYGGHAVVLVGHCNPRVVKAINEQAKKLVFYSNIVFNDVRAQASELIIKVSPKGLSKVFFCNSGSEANEAALKIARKFTGKDEVISMEGSFHGRTVGALSSTGIEKYRSQIPASPNSVFAKFGDIESLRSLITGRTAAVIMEPIQGMAGIVMADEKYYLDVRELCTQNGIVLIFDEVQSCFGRTGKMFAANHWNITPDIMTCAKGMAGGFPMGAAVISDEIAKTISVGEQGSTFGGGPLACACAKATIETVIDENLMENSTSIGKYIKKRAARMKQIREVRGIGLLLGLKFESDCSGMLPLLLEKGIIAGVADVDKSVLRLMPPLTIGKADVDKLFTAISDVVGDSK
ncbi:aminotransferase class III-fold pyridoxal phosphate-dependent enzyme [Candidatus Woesearchaeota archaeon]|nr:aminotransferase class III-fold pyridoxal phosphate-dependent enzyme [Candidatus Woesearchaeota archaeon]